MSPLSSLEPKLFWQHFEALAKVPRPSGKEEKVRNFLIAAAARRGLKHRTDSTGNLVVYIPATKGRDGAPPVIIQGHLDMVCEKNPDVKIDFEKDPLKLVVEGGFVKAAGTTLGADNGVMIAAGLALADDPDSAHGPLELLFTVEEETGLVGAAGLDASMLSGKHMLNLDSEEDGVVFIGCAGGVRGELTLKINTQKAPTGVKPMQVIVSGLKGGHSGLNINDNRANALKLLAVVLLEAVAAGAKVVSVSGGNMFNAIPRDAKAEIVVPRGREDQVAAAIEKAAALFKGIHGLYDPDIAVKVEPAKNRPRKIIAGPSVVKALRLILALPQGVLSMSREVPGLVETSNNVGILVTGKDTITISTCSRSSVNESLTMLIRTVESIGALAGAKVEHKSRYSGWRPNKSSALLATAQKAARSVNGKPMEEKAVHAGLECGIIMEKLPGLDVISFGPHLDSVHSPSEKVEIESVGRFYRYLKALLASIG